MLTGSMQISDQKQEAVPLKTGICFPQEILLLVEETWTRLQPSEQECHICVCTATGVRSRYKPGSPRPG